MRIRISDSEMAAAFTGLARLRPDVVVTRMPSRRPAGAAASEYELGLLGSLNSEARSAALGGLVRGWAAQLRGERDGELEVLR